MLVPVNVAATVMLVFGFTPLTGTAAKLLLPVAVNVETGVALMPKNVFVTLVLLALSVYVIAMTKEPAVIAVTKISVVTK